MARLRIGSVPYLNALPITEGLEEASGVDFITATPAQLEADLDAGRLDAALVPVVFLFTRPNYSMFPSIGIASEEEAGSVLFFQRTPKPARVAFDAGSRSSVALLRILLMAEGVQPDWIPMEPKLDKMLSLAEGALMIGDPALASAKDPRLAFDLVARWKKVTGAPFVFAVWAARSDHLRRQDIGWLIEDAAKKGLNRLAAISQRNDGKNGMNAMDILVYFTKNLRYRLGIVHLDAIDTFKRKYLALPPMNVLGALPPGAGGAGQSAGSLSGAASAKPAGPGQNPFNPSKPLRIL